MLRIISGKYRSLKIEVPDTINTRPTLDRVREGLMSALCNDIEDAVVLDLFSGSGALGLESLSRGAKKVYFIDKSPLAINTIKKNVAYLKEEDKSVILKMSYEGALEHFRKNGIKFDIVFLDPPYKMKEVYKQIRNILIDYDLLNNNAVLVEESDDILKEEYGNSKDYKYGKVRVRITRGLTK